ncbi:DUF6309 family protein [Nocardiopsis coralliicola]
METVEQMAFADVQRLYRSDHPCDRVHPSNTNRDGARNLELADALFSAWFRIRLSRADALAVVLPWHLSEGGEEAMVPPTGLTVGQAAERVRAGGARWTRANPVCAAKLELLGRSPLTHVYLSGRALPDHPHYDRVRTREGLIHLDGLHRLVAWELAGRLPAAEALGAVVAGGPPPDTPPPPDGGEAGAGSTGRP